MRHVNLRIPTFVLSTLWLLGTIVFVGVLANASESDREVAIRTILLGLSAGAIALPLGALIAWVATGRGWIAQVLMMVSFAMLITPMLIHVSGWDAAFGKLGWLTSSRGQILKPLVSGWSAASWIHGVAAAPQVALILLFGGGLGRRAYEEQALMDTTPSGVFWNISIRRFMPLVILSLIWVIILCAREIAVTDLYQVGTLAEQIYLGYSLGLNAIPGTWTPEQLAQAGNLGVWTTVSLVAWLTVTAFSFFIGLTQLEHQSSIWHPSKIRRSGAWKNTIGIALLVVMAGVPIGNVVFRACFFVRPVDGIPTQGYSIDQLFRSIKRAVIDYRDEFVWSFLIAVVAASIIIFLAVFLASLSRRSRMGQLLFVVSLAFSCAIPGPYLGNLITQAFTSIDHPGIVWLYNYTIAAPVIANIIFCWPVGALLIWYVFRQIPEDVLESASLDGAGKIQRFLQFGVSANAGTLAGCWLISFAFSFGELSASQMVRPAGIDTVPRKMLGDLHAGVNELTAGITIVTAFAIVAISLLGWWIIRLNQPAAGRK